MDSQVGELPVGTRADAGQQEDRCLPTIRTRKAKEFVIVDRLIQAGHLPRRRLLGVPVLGINPPEADEGQRPVKEVDGNVVARFLF